VILTVHELKRLARNAGRTDALSAQLQTCVTGLELLTGRLTGIYDPTLRAGIQPRPPRPRHIGETTQKLTIKTGKSAGQHPSIASPYRALAEAAN
jgi:hypothetical protein